MHCVLYFFYDNVFFLCSGYQKRMQQILDKMKTPEFTEFNKCLLVGNFVTGVSIHDCIHNTKEILKHNGII